MIKRVPIQDFKAALSAAIAQAESGETLIITRHNHPVARLGPAQPGFITRGQAVGRYQLRPLLRRATKGRYLEVLLEDRGER